MLLPHASPLQSTTLSEDAGKKAIRDRARVQIGHDPHEPCNNPPRPPIHHDMTGQDQVPDRDSGYNQGYLKGYGWVGRRMAPRAMGLH